MKINSHEAYDNFLNYLIEIRPTNISIKNLIFIVKTYYQSNLLTPPIIQDKKVILSKNERTVEILLGIKDTAFVIYKLNGKKIKEYNITNNLIQGIENFIEYLIKGHVPSGRAKGKAKIC